ncbi:MAG: GNAT family N-acetyltransferase [Gammaproteobacteria bacterium]|nr:GNAT family N-acetyltransferase [Gammaproteobacteria bacterium]
MLEIVEADLSNPQHAQALVELLDAYALDPMGGGTGLSDYCKQQLVQKLQQRDDAVVILAFNNNQAVGLLNAFEGFSTFACQPLLNIHDVYVAPAVRKRGIAQNLFEKTEAIARSRGCCKLTLEVLSENYPAQAAYIKSGFNAYQLDPEKGSAVFWQKVI